MAKKTTTPTNTITTDTITSYKAQRDAFVQRLTVLVQDQARVDEEKARLAEEATRIDEEKRLIEEALATDGGSASDNGTSSPHPTRKVAVRAGKVGKNGKPAKPTGAIMPAIWDFLVKHPGAKSGEIRSGIRIEGKSLAQTLLAGGTPKARIEEKAKMSIGTALNAMKKNGRLIVKGDRSNYKYHVNA